MDILSLPSFIELGGKKYKIDADFRNCISIMQMFEDTEIYENEKPIIMVKLLFFEEIPNKVFYEAIEKSMMFLDIQTSKEQLEENNNFTVDNIGRLYSWSQDIKYIIPAVDRVLGFSSRRQQFLHWWEFIGSFMEIGECTFTTLIHQRKLKKTGKQTKDDKEWWNNNRNIAELKIDKKQLNIDEQHALEKFNKLLN